MLDMYCQIDVLFVLSFCTRFPKLQSVEIQRHIHESFLERFKSLVEEILVRFYHVAFRPSFLMCHLLADLAAGILHNCG